MVSIDDRILLRINILTSNIQETEVDFGKCTRYIHRGRRGEESFKKIRKLHNGHRLYILLNLVSNISDDWSTVCTNPNAKRKLSVYRFIFHNFLSRNKTALIIGDLSGIVIVNVSFSQPDKNYISNCPELRTFPGSSLFSIIFSISIVYHTSL